MANSVAGFVVPLLQHSFDVVDGSTAVDVRITVPTLDVAYRHPVSLVGQDASLFCID